MGSRVWWLLCIVALVVLPACGAPSRSLARFGSATHSLGDGIALTTRGNARVCELKQQLVWDYDAALDQGSAKAVFDALQAESCALHWEKAAFYQGLARQLGAFGLAMRMLAGPGEADDTADLLVTTGALPSDLGASQADAAGSDDPARTLVASAGRRYSKKQLRLALDKSNESIVATLDLLDAIAKVYLEALNGYVVAIGNVATDGDFTLPAEGDPPSDAAIEARRARIQAQIDLVRYHGAMATKQIAAVRKLTKTLQRFRKTHAALVDRAKSKSGDLDSPELLAAAEELAVEVAAFRALAREASVE